MVSATRTLITAALASGLLTAVAAGGAVAQPTGGYMLMEHFQTAAAGLRRVNLRGIIVNKCSSSLPNGSYLQIGYDNAPIILKLPIAALLPGQKQQFNQTVGVPPTQKTNNTTLLSFALYLPGAVPDQKTSPCTIEFFKPF